MGNLIHMARSTDTGLSIPLRCDCFTDCFTLCSIAGWKVELVASSLDK